MDLRNRELIDKFVNIDKKQGAFLTCRNGINDGRIVVDINHVEKSISML